MNVRWSCRTTSTTLLLVLFAYANLLPGSEAKPGPSWPEFHGPGRTNISPETGPAEEMAGRRPAADLEVSRSAARAIRASSIAEGMIFTAGDFDDAEMLLALDLDGRLLWKAPNGEAWLRLEPRLADHAHLRRRARCTT